MSEMRLSFRIPTDHDGYILLQCHRCGEYFKIPSEHFKDETILELRCPACGMVSDNFLTDETMELTQTMAENVMVDIINEEMKNLEKQFRNSKDISFKRGKELRRQYETPVRAGVDSLTKTDCRCCMRKAKVKPLLKIAGCYCPFCGVMNFEAE